MANGGYDRERDGSFIGWWLRWMLVGVLIAVGLFVVLIHVANVRVEKQREYREECYEHGPRDSDGDPVCDRDFMPSYTSSSPYFRSSKAVPSGS
jgi:hypothetical protein